MSNPSGVQAWRAQTGVAWALLPGLLLAAAVQASVLRAGNGPEPETLDPQRSETVSAGNILRDLYEGLTSLGSDGQVVPGAAQSWELSADRLVYTFHLRPQARWSNGDPLTADDFIAGLRRTVDPATAYQYAQLL